MPYTTTNVRVYRQALISRWATLEALDDLVRALQRCDYSVIAARREAHANLNSFLDAMSRGSTIFNTQTRFPDHDDSLYVTTFSPNTESRLNALANVLSHRSTNVAKDVAAPRNGGKDSTSDATSEQGEQDNAKRFEELTLQLTRCELFDRRHTEVTLSLTWA
jgi:hypothetical protein